MKLDSTDLDPTETESLPFLSLMSHMTAVDTLSPNQICGLQQYLPYHVMIVEFGSVASTHQARDQVLRLSATLALGRFTYDLRLCQLFHFTFELWLLKHTGQDTEQSTVYPNDIYDFSGWKAVDGTYNHSMHSLAHTNREKEPWWRVNLGSRRCVLAVYILPRAGNHSLIYPIIPTQFMTAIEWLHTEPTTVLSCTWVAYMCLRGIWGH